jgi:hypothetical protein
MARTPKTQRTTATIRAAELAAKLHVERTVVYAHMHKLGVQPRYGFGKQVFFTPAQANLIEHAIRTTQPEGLAALKGEHAKVLLGALEKGATAIQLVTEHGATLEESDTACAWWRNKRGEMILSPLEIDQVQSRIGKFESSGQLLTMIEESILAAQTCNNCGVQIKAPLCKSCVPRLGRPARPKPENPEASAIDDTFEKQMGKLKELEDREKELNGTTETS